MQSLVLLAILLCSTLSAKGFSLLGPFEPWQTPALGYNGWRVEVGGPKNIGEEYRINVPIITYGFDEQFISFFGEAGVLAVDQAMNVLNQLPNASDIDLNHYDLEVRRLGGEAPSWKNIFNLELAALCAVIEQFGLAPAHKHLFAMRERLAFPTATNYFVIRRNFDPVTLQPSSFLNGLRYSYQVFEFSYPLYYVDALELEPVVDLGGMPLSSMFFIYDHSGVYVTGLSRDDAGGLKYLLSSENINPEYLPDDVEPLATGQVLKNLAYRPGVEKIQLLKITDNWQFSANFKKEVQFDDKYYDDNFLLQTQRVRRVITKPDIIFSMDDFQGFNTTGWARQIISRSAPKFVTTVPNASGPGVIFPGATIRFEKLHSGFHNQFPGSTLEPTLLQESRIHPRWAWFGAHQAIVTFPDPNNLALAPRLSLTRQRFGVSLGLVGLPGAPYQIEQSSDLQTWTTIQDAIATNGTFTLTLPRTSSSMFFRAHWRSKFKP